MKRAGVAMLVVACACGGSSTGAGDAGGSGDGDGSSGAADASPPIDCTEVVCHYVSAGAGEGGDGSDWSRAWQALPDDLERGHVYYLAAGDYPGYRFDDPASGDQVITVVRATADDHGDGAGWEDGLAGRAVFGPVELTEPYYLIDGRGRGIAVRGEFQGTALVVAAGDQVLRSLDIDGAFAADASDQHVGGACTALEVNASDVTIAGSDIHDAADDGAALSNLTGLRFEGNLVHALHACGTDGGCGPCFNGHSDGLEMFNVKQSEVRGNLIYDVRSTATVFFGNWGAPEEYNDDITIENNLFYAPEVGLVVYIHYASNIRFLHNVVWGVQQGAYGGLSIGPEVTDLDMYNNIILSVNYSHQGATFDPEEHRGDHNLFGVDLEQWQSRAGDLVAGNPAFAGIPGINGQPVLDPEADMFALEAGSKAIDKGAPTVDAVPLPATDFFGDPRDGAPDIGAIER